MNHWDSFIVKSLLFGRLAEVEVKVKEELRKTEAELDRELDQTTNAVDQQMNLQKQLVWGIPYYSNCPFDKFKRVFKSMNCRDLTHIPIENP